jgi:PEGA domain
MPWLFTLIFLIFAPILVFYTAGYRWNPKKGIVEKNGTVILDTTPRGANIFLNDQNIDETTPATLQNIAPGTYTIRVEKPGYHTWEKTLSVLQERVTFANEIFMWPQLEPELLFSQEISKIITNPDFDFLLGLKTINDEQILFRYEREKIAEEIGLNEKIVISSATWDRSGEKAIVEGYASSTEKVWLLQADPLEFTELPEGRYHFERSELVGMSEVYRLSLNSNGALTKVKHGDQVVDTYGDLEIRNLPNEENLVLLLSTNADEGLILPHGDWQFYAIDGKELLLKYRHRWLRISTDTDPYTNTQATAVILNPLEINRENSYLLQNNNELYLWHPLLEPELLYRQSEPIIATGWHPEGYSIYLATKNVVKMINLDSRDGRVQTVLATFDEIQDVVLVEDDLFITGTKENNTGLWKLPLVKSSNLSPLSALDNVMKF